MSESIKPRLVWVAEYDDDSEYLSVMERLDTQGKYEGVTVCRLHGESAADLIAEAGTVHHETGLTPRQLVERVKELEGALKGCAAVCAGETMSKNGLVLALENARAALAKCQGEKE